MYPIYAPTHASVPSDSSVDIVRTYLLSAPRKCTLYMLRPMPPFHRIPEEILSVHEYLLSVPMMCIRYMIRPMSLFHRIPEEILSVHTYLVYPGCVSDICSNPCLRSIGSLRESFPYIPTKCTHDVYPIYAPFLRSIRSLRESCLYIPIKCTQDVNPIYAPTYASVPSDPRGNLVRTYLLNVPSITRYTIQPMPPFHRIPVEILSAHTY